MSEFVNFLKTEFYDFLPQLRQSFQERRNTDIENACFDERNNNIALAVIAMLDAGLNDEIVIEKLQKYWDLRRSETAPFLKWGHKQLKLQKKN